jgi:hypothetical protein
VVLGALSASGAAPAGSRPAVDPQADAWFKKMSECLVTASRLKFNVYALTEQSLDNGQKVEFARNSAVSMRRPNRLDVAMAGDQEDLRVIYDGQQVTIDNLRKKVYGQIPVPGTIDAAIDTLAQKYGMVMPLADLMVSDPYKTLSPLIRSGEYLGMGYVFDTKCHHLAFRQDAVDWQIWIDAGEQPLPRKIVITYKETPDKLEYVAYFSKWDLNPQFSDATFTFVPAADAKKLDALVPATQPGK